MCRLFSLMFAIIISIMLASCSSNVEENEPFDFHLEKNNWDVAPSPIIPSGGNVNSTAHVVVDIPRLPPSDHVLTPISRAFVETASPVGEVENADIAQSFAAEIIRCGIEADKSGCLKSPILVRSSTVAELSDGWLTFTLLEHTGLQKRVGLVVESDRKTPVANIRKAKLVEVGMEAIEAEAIKNDYLLNRSRTILHVCLAADSVDYALRAIKQTDADYRSLFHAVSYLALYVPKYRTEIIEMIGTHYESFALATGFDAATYQRSLLKVLLNKSLSETELLRVVARRFLRLTDPRVAQGAAIVLARKGEQSEEIRNKVRAAVNSEDSNFRILAIDALNHIRQGANDDNLIIAHFTDYDKDVRALVKSIIADWTLTDEHLPMLEKLAAHWNDEVRKEIVRVVKCIPSHGGSALLIRLLSGWNAGVRAVVSEALNKRALTNEDLAPLTRLLRGDINWEVRRIAVNYIATISSEDAAHTLIAALTDHNSDVRHAIITALDRYTMTNSELEFLRPLLSAMSLDVKKKAVEYIAKINTTEAASAIIPSLKDYNSELRQTAWASLKNMPITAEMLPLIEEVTHQVSNRARIHAAALLGRIKTERATQVLLSLVFDRDSKVRTAAISAIADHPFTAQHVEELNASLNATLSSVRERAAKVLGLSGNCLAVTLLKERDKRESNGHVKNAIAQALQALLNCQS